MSEALVMGIAVGSAAAIWVGLTWSIVWWVSRKAERPVWVFRRGLNGSAWLESQGPFSGDRFDFCIAWADLVATSTPRDGDTFVLIGQKLERIVLVKKS